METNASPIMRGAIAFSIVIVALGLFALCIRWQMSLLNSLNSARRDNETIWQTLETGH